MGQFIARSEPFVISSGNESNSESNSDSINTFTVIPLDTNNLTIRFNNNQKKKKVINSKIYCCNCEKDYTTFDSIKTGTIATWFKKLYLTTNHSLNYNGTETTNTEILGIS